MQFPKHNLWVTVLVLIGLSSSSTAAANEPPPRKARPQVRPGVRLPLQFHSERIRLTILPDSVEVDGLYRFVWAKGSAGSTRLFFPYPRDSLLGGARTLLLESLSSDGLTRTLPYEELGKNRGARWTLVREANDTLTVRTVYRQQLHTCYARYIVMTTQAWSQPLKRARFEVLLPAKVDTASFSYPFELQEHDFRRVWVYEVDDFMPHRDIEVRWNCYESRKDSPLPQD
jgi:hypothetical protein